MSKARTKVKKIKEAMPWNKDKELTETSLVAKYNKIHKRYLPYFKPEHLTGDKDIQCIQNDKECVLDE